MKYKLDLMERTLANGMQVILVSKKDYRKSLFMIGIPAGGFNIKEEKNGQEFTNPSGAAHFLEHQMFRLNGRDVTEDFASMQASTNAFTSYTETCYYFSTTADYKKPLALLMDFVQNLDIDENSVNKEKGIIVSEYNIYDQQPEQQLIKQMFHSLYENHPLNKDILGTVADIDNMTEEDLRAFYNTNYDPSRLILVGITGKELQPVMDFIEEHEKLYPSKESSAVKREYGKEADDVVRKYYEKEMDISIPMIAIGYKCKPAWDVMTSIREDLCITMWIDSLFTAVNPDYQKWLDEKIISAMAGGECDIADDHAYVLFYAQTSKTEEFTKLVHDLVENHKYVSEEAFRALKIQYIARNIRGLDNFQTVALDLLRSRFDDFDYREAMKIAEDLTLEEVNETVRRLDLSHEAVVKIVPQKNEE